MDADYVHAVMYCYDFEMFTEFYKIKSINIIEMRVAPARPMNNAIRRYIVDLYRDKTSLPNDDEHRDERNFVKQQINGIYGDMVQRQFEDIVVFKQNGLWSIDPITPEKYEEIREEKIKAGYKLYKSMLAGIAIPSIARRNLWRGVIAPLDDQIVYFDTDCGKWLGNDNGVISSYNMSVLRQHAKIEKELGLEPGALSPADPDGKIHPIGCLEWETGPEGLEDFKTLGAKKYAVKDNGKIKITIAGVPKKNAVKLKSVDDLSEDLVFSSEECGKNLLYYNTEQPEIVFPDGFVSREKYGICFQPAGYKLGITPEYIGLLAVNDGLRNKTYHKIFNGRVKTWQNTTL